MKKLLLWGMACLTALPMSAMAITALDSQRTTGNQTWTGALGMDFDVLSPVTVTHLGAFDSGQDGFAGTIEVGIFDRLTSSLVGSSTSLAGLAGTAVGNQRFVDIADFTLAAGQYSIVAVGFGGSDPNGNTANGGAGPTIDTGGGLISFVGGARYTGTSSLVFPGTLDTGPANRYDAGTFQYVNAVPEPSAYLMALAGIAVLGGLAHRSRRRS